jgi:hypothetical protein
MGFAIFFRVIRENPRMPKLNAFALPWDSIDKTTKE